MQKNLDLQDLSNEFQRDSYDFQIMDMYGVNYSPHLSATALVQAGRNRLLSDSSQRDF